MRAVIFDLFETLITEWVSEKYTKRKTAADLGADYDKYFQGMEKLHDKMYRGQCNFVEAVASCCRECEITPEKDKLDAVVEKRIKTNTVCFTYPHPEISEMLSAVKEKGYRLGLISNCSSEEVTVFKNSAIYPFFDAVVLSYEAGIVKPDTPIYKLCSERLGVEPGECLFVGDGGSDELWGAENAGMKSLRAMWFLDKYTKNVKPTPYPCAHKPSEILEYLETMK
jgi:putative hydrolase of the HAD superfamily